MNDEVIKKIKKKLKGLTADEKLLMLMVALSKGVPEDFSK
tara:strand:+ start:99 stop:218 length:120 start_codon:yes stop_codon:yes gene_type:complete